MNSSQAKALVYYMFAALGGNVKAQMALVIMNNFSIIKLMASHNITRTCLIIGGLPSQLAQLAYLPRLAWFSNNNNKFLYYYYIDIENFTCFDS